MNPGNTHGATLNDKPRQFAHRRLDEEVLHSAQEEVLCGPMSIVSSAPVSAQSRLTQVEMKMACYAAQQPLRAALFAMAIGGLLTLAVQRSVMRVKWR